MTDFSIELIGYIASALIVFGLAPQAIKTIITKKTRDISLIAFATMFSGAAIFVLYGLLLSPMNWPIIITNTCAGTLQLTILIMKLRHG